MLGWLHITNCKVLFYNLKICIMSDLNIGCFQTSPVCSQRALRLRIIVGQSLLFTMAIHEDPFFQLYYLNCPGKYVPWLYHQFMAPLATPLIQPLKHCNQWLKVSARSINLPACSQESNQLGGNGLFSLNMSAGVVQWNYCILRQYRKE